MWHDAAAVLQTTRSALGRLKAATHSIMRRKLPPWDAVGILLQGSFVLGCYTCYSVWPSLFGRDIGTGEAIAALGFAAILMTARGERLLTFEKTVWVIIGACLLYAELRIIERDRNSQETTHRDEIQTREQQFVTTVNELISTEHGIKDANHQETRHFGALVRQQQAIFSGMQDSEQETLDAMTGGDSYDVISPVTLNAGSKDPSFPLMISVKGKHLLWDVKLEMEQAPIDPLYEASHLAEYCAGKSRTTFDLGSVSTTYGRPIGFVVHPSLGRVNSYYFWHSRETP